MEVIVSTQSAYNYAVTYMIQFQIDHKLNLPPYDCVTQSPSAFVRNDCGSLALAMTSHLNTRDPCYVLRYQDTNPRPYLSYT